MVLKLTFPDGHIEKVFVHSNILVSNAPEWKLGENELLVTFFRRTKLKYDTLLIKGMY